MANVVLLGSASLLRIKLSKFKSFLKKCLKGFWEFFMMIIIYLKFIIIFIIIISVPPELTTYPINQTKIEGGNMTFTCDATGNPEPLIVWFKDGSLTILLPEISYSFYTKQLFIPNVSRRDSGEYACVAFNNVGYVRSNSVSLNVYCKNIFLFFFLL